MQGHEPLGTFVKMQSYAHTYMHATSAMKHTAGTNPVSHIPQRRPWIAIAKLEISPTSLAFEVPPVDVGQSRSSPRVSVFLSTLSTLSVVFLLQLHEDPRPGDLIEIDHIFYRHWAVDVGDGCVVHVSKMGT